jgi:hypothetical protein
MQCNGPIKITMVTVITVTPTKPPEVRPNLNVWVRGSGTVEPHFHQRGGDFQRLFWFWCHTDVEDFGGFLHFKAHILPVVNVSTGQGGHRHHFLTIRDHYYDNKQSRRLGPERRWQRIGLIG